MADEISIVTSFSLTKGNHKIPNEGSAAIKVTQTGTGGGGPGVITAVTTGTGTTVDVTPIGTLGYGRFQNLDLTNFADLGVLSGGTLYKFARLKPNEPAALFRITPGIVLAVQADTASCKVRCEVYEN